MTYKDLDEDPSAADELRAVGSSGIPTFVRGNDVVIGFQPDKIKAMLE